MHTLTAVEVDADTCDACPHAAQAAAFLYAENPAWASSLAFCSHHGTEYLPNLIGAGATVIDMRHLVTA